MTGKENGKRRWVKMNKVWVSRRNNKENGKRGWVEMNRCMG